MHLAPSFAPRALVLDMDGLMVDSEPLWFQVERAFAADHGADWTHELSLRCVGRGTPFTLAMMSERFGFDVDIARDEAAITEAFVAGVDALAFKPGCGELLG
jgi:mannitol-1-/sugar-/sorbitol-6-/2-deoxyglucose-6-phosphatase